MASVVILYHDLTANICCNGFFVVFGRDSVLHRIGTAVRLLSEQEAVGRACTALRWCERRGLYEFVPVQIIAYCWR